MPYLFDNETIGPEVTANELRQMKAKIDEDARIKSLKLLVTDIYKKTISFAKSHTEQKFVYHPDNNWYSRNDFINKNQDDIENHVAGLFPDSCVEIRIYALGGNKQYCDITDMDESTRQCFDIKNSKFSIVIDWS